MKRVVSNLDAFVDAIVKLDDVAQGIMAAEQLVEEEKRLLARSISKRDELAQEGVPTVVTDLTAFIEGQRKVCELDADIFKRERTIRELCQQIDTRKAWFRKFFPACIWFQSGDYAIGTTDGDEVKVLPWSDDLPSLTPINDAIEQRASNTHETNSF